MRDARPGGGPAPKPISKRNTAGVPPPKHSNISAQLAHYNRQQGTSRGHGGAAQILKPGKPKSPKQDYPGTSFKSAGFRRNYRDVARALDTIGQYTVGLGMVKPSHAPGNILRNVGVHTSLPHDPKSGVSIGMVPFVPRPSGIRPAAWGEGPGGIPKGPGMPKTNADLARLEAKRALAEAEKEPGPTATEKVGEGLKKGRAKGVYREKKQLRHEELTKRVEKAQEALAKGTGEEAFRAARRELKGPFPQPEFHGLRDLTSEEMTKLKEHIRNHPDLTFFDKTTAEQALRSAHEHGQVPAPHEHRALEKAFGPELVAREFSPSALSKWKHRTIETVNIPRAAMSSVDVSGVGRQALVALISHPIVTGKELGPMVKALGSEDYYRGWRHAIESDPEYEGFVEHGGAATDIEHSLANREEAFQSNYAEKITGGRRSPIRMSGRAYNRLLVGVRFALYKHLKNYADKTGRHLDDKALNQLASLVNDATGRGTGKPGGFLERNAVALNATFFSPRLIKSRFSFLNPKSYMGLDPFVRREKIKMAAQTAAAISTFLYAMSRVAGVKVGHDPRSSDFGKIRIGNTRIDVGGGFNQYIRVFAQGVANGEIDPNTGEITHGQTLNILNRFARGKLAPPVSLGADLLLRSNYAGQQIDPMSGKYWEKRLGGLGIPLAIQDAYAVQQQTHNPLAALGAYGLAATGVGVQSYGPKKTTPAKTTVDLRNAFKENVRKYYGRDLTPQIDKALRLRETRTFYFKTLPRDAGARDKYNAQIDLMLKQRMITPAQAKRAKDWASKQKDKHVLRSRTSELGRKYFGGEVLSSAAKKIRDKGGHLYLGDY